MSARVTMQDIADALGLSRNTVSKAINNTGIIAQSTRELILRKAVEMGYRQFSDASFSGISISGVNPAGFSQPITSGVSPVQPASTDRREIALITASRPGNSHFGVTTLDRMQQIFSSYGYCLTIYTLLPGDLDLLRLPGNLNTSNLAGIFSIELFHYEYCRMLSSLGLPFLMIDGPAEFHRDDISADLLLMENKKGIYTFLQQMAAKGKKTVGFIGNMKHCRSFFERGAACISAAAYYGYEPVQPYSILVYPPKTSPARIADSSDELYVMLRKIPVLPEILVCANDFLAINLISSLRRMGVSCPEDVLVLGFDDSPESRFHSPSLSTVHIHTQGMGRIAAELLLGRITDISREYRITYMPTELILRESTEERPI